MNAHVADDRLNDYLDDLLPDGERREVERHLSECAACRAEAARLSSLIHGVAGLPREATPGRELWSGVAERIGAAAPAGLRGEATPAGHGAPRRERLLFTLPQLAAAALALFILGVFAGRQLVLEVEEDVAGAGTAEAVIAAVPRDAAASAALVQRTGSAYIAALATLRRAPGGSDPAGFEQGREAGLAALHGAAKELNELAPADPGASQILATVGSVRMARVGEGEMGDPGTIAW